MTSKAFLPLPQGPQQSKPQRAMSSYLLYSSYVHFALLALLFLLSRGSFAPKKQQAYFIDFIGPSKVVTMQKAGEAPGEALPPAQAEAVPAKSGTAAPPEVRPEADDFASGPLPKPSVLSGGASLLPRRTAGAQAPSGENGTPLLADAANFPYPWYITQVREALWNSWGERMPSGGSLRCTVRFDITRNGGIRRAAVERSSGNRLFDNAAEGAAHAAAPFPPLPDDFLEDTLTVHVEFKAAD